MAAAAASGRGATLGPRSAVPSPELLVAAELRGTGSGDAEIVLAGALQRTELERLFADRLHWRREVGILTKDAKVVKRIAELFESDWAKTELGQKEHKVGEKELALTEAAS